MTCTICRHPHRANIEAALVQGVALRAIEAQFGVSDNALHRHKTNCVPETVAKVKADADDFSAENLIRILQDVRQKSYDIYERNKGVDDGIALKALRSVDGTIQTSARIAQVIAESRKVHGGETLAQVLQKGRQRALNAHREKETLQAEIERLKSIVAGRSLTSGSSEVIEGEVCDPEPTENG